MTTEHTYSPETAYQGGLTADESDKLRRDQWAGKVILRGLLPRVPALDALPAASLDYLGCLVRIVATPSTLHIGMVDTSGNPEWIQIATGT